MMRKAPFGASRLLRAPSLRASRRRITRAIPQFAASIAAALAALLPSAECRGQAVAQGDVKELRSIFSVAPVGLKTVSQKQTSTALPMVIGEVVVIGSRTLSPIAVALASGHKEGDACTPQTLNEMHDSLLRTGWFGLHSADIQDAVRVHAETDPLHPGRCKVVIEVDENDAVAGVAVRGSGPIRPEEITPLLHLKQGMVYNPLQFRRDFDDIHALYERRGYLMTASTDAGLDEKDILNVAIQVVRVGEIHLIGARHTRPTAVLRVIRSRRDGYLNRELLQEDRLRLLNLGLFDTVEIIARDQGAGLVGLDVQVKERQVRSITGGFTYGARDGVSGTAQVADNNFRGLGESLGLSGELSTDLKRHSVALDYRNPWLDARQTGLDLQLYDKSVARFADSLTSSGNQYLQQRTGGSAALSRPLNNALQLELTLRGEQTYTDPTGLAVSNAAIVQDGPLYSIGGALKRDTRDLISDPSRGGYQTLSLNVGHADLQSPISTVTPYGSQNFVRSSLDYRVYLSLSGARRADHPDEEKTSLAFRVMAGGSAGKLPFAEQFFLGGADTLRGYREDRFWGSNLLLGSMELRQPIAPRFKFVAFMDVGRAWGGDYGGLNLSGFNQRGDASPHIGAGFGVRAGTPIGSVRLDLGFGDEGARAHFGFGHTF